MQEQDRRSPAMENKELASQANYVDHGTCDLISRRLAHPCTAAPLRTEPLHGLIVQGGTPLQVNNLFVCSTTTVRSLRYHTTSTIHNMKQLFSLFSF